MKTAVLYIHGKGGSASESEHYKPLFPYYEVIGLDYKSFTPVKTLREDHEKIILIANSIGAYFCMHADIEKPVQTAFFISPIVDMERLILDMMKWANVSESDLKRERVITTPFGEDLSWDYLCYVREHPLKWNITTHILYGENDNLTSIDTITDFAARHNASLTVMENGEHWFHTEEQLKYLDNWILSH